MKRSPNNSLRFASPRRRRPASFVDPPHDEKDMSACGLIGFLNRDGTRVSGDLIRAGIANMHDRGNGLGGGFAAYGVYPEFADQYALHLMYDRKECVPAVEAYLNQTLRIVHSEPLPTDPQHPIHPAPVFHRYFVDVPEDIHSGLSPDDYLVQVVMKINAESNGAFVMSSGKNMGAWKGVGHAEDIGDFFGIQNYAGYLWLAHARFPTNTPGWWGGAHPFTLLDWAIVHNGEISSYGINKRYLESAGYRCTLQTDTEVVAYLLDLLVRRHHLSFEDACTVLAPPFWKDIDAMTDGKGDRLRRLRQIYASAALNGPFAFLFGYSGGLIGLNDRIKLRPFLVGEKGETIYMASEEAALRVLCPDVENVSAPTAGVPVIARLRSHSAQASLS